MFLFPILKSSSTKPLFSPFLSNDAPDNVDCCNPNRAKSIANRIVDFPEPISPANNIEPPGNSIFRFKYDLIFSSLSLLIFIF